MTSVSWPEVTHSRKWRKSRDRKWRNFPRFFFLLLRKNAEKLRHFRSRDWRHFRLWRHFCRGAKTISLGNIVLMWLLWEAITCCSIDSKKYILGRKWKFRKIIKRKWYFFLWKSTGKWYAENGVTYAENKLRCISNVAVWKSTVKWNFLWRHVRGKQVTLPVIFVLQSFNMFIYISLFWE